MANTFLLEGLVLKGTDYGETDRIITLYTKENGKVHALAKGARKGKSRLRGCVQLFTYARFSLAKGKNLDVITQGEILDPFLLLKEDLTKIAYASYFAELLRSSSAENKPQPQIFILLLASWSFLEENLPPALVARFFELRLLHYYGYSPRLDQCVFCGRGIPGGGFRLVPWRGGVACLSCAEKNQVVGRPLSAGTVLMMDKLLHAELSKIGTLHASVQGLKEMEDALGDYWQYHMENSLESRKIIHELLMGNDV